MLPVHRVLPRRASSRNVADGRCKLQPFLTSALGKGECSASRPALVSKGKDPATSSTGAGCAPQQISTLWRRIFVLLWQSLLFAELLARSQYASGRSSDRSSLHKFSLVFLSSSKCWDGFQDSKLLLHASHAVLPTWVIKINPLWFEEWEVKGK